MTLLHPKRETDRYTEMGSKIHSHVRLNDITLFAIPCGRLAQVISYSKVTFALFLALYFYNTCYRVESWPCQDDEPALTVYFYSHGFRCCFVIALLRIACSSSKFHATRQFFLVEEMLGVFEDFPYFQGCKSENIFFIKSLDCVLKVCDWLSRLREKKWRESLGIKTLQSDFVFHPGNMREENKWKTRKLGGKVKREGGVDRSAVRVH